MKKTLLYISAVVIACMTGCTKSIDTPEIAPQGKPMTITVGIEGSSKASYTWNDTEKVLKGEWEAGDKISVISLNDISHVLTVDTFTTTESGASANFTGTYTGAADAYRKIVVYPALTSDNVTIGDTSGWGFTPQAPFISSHSTLVLSNSQSFGRYDFQNLNQIADGSASHLNNADLMRGEITDINNPTAVLKKFTGVLRLDLTMPASLATDTQLTMVQITSTKNSFGPSAWFYSRMLDSDLNKGGDYSYLRMSLGNAVSPTGTETTGIAKSAGDKLVVYIPYVGYSTIPAGESLTIIVKKGAFGATVVGSKTAVLSAPLTFERGKVHNITATLE